MCGSHLGVRVAFRCMGTHLGVRDSRDPLRITFNVFTNKPTSTIYFLIQIAGLR